MNWSRVIQNGEIAISIPGKGLYTKSMAGCLVAYFGYTCLDCGKIFRKKE